MTLITVIVRCYNAEKTLARTLDSLAKQTYRELEILIIDDGSTDNSMKIASEYQAKSDPRIRIVPMKHQGIFYATKCGVENAKGDFIGFVDSDDYVAPEMYQKMLEAITLYDCDMAQCESMVDSNGNLTPHQKVFSPCVFNRMEAMEKLTDESGIIRHGLAYILCKKILFGQVEWHYSFICEDVGLKYQLLHQSKKIVCLPDMFYYTNKNVTSLSRSNYIPEKYDRFSVFNRMRHFLNANGYERFSSYALGAAVGTIYVAVGELYRDSRLSSRRKEYMQRIKQDVTELSQNANLSSKQRILLNLCIKFPFIWGGIWRYYHK